MTTIKISEENLPTVLQLLTDFVVANHQIEIFSLITEKKNNFLELYKNKESIHATKIALIDLQDVHYKAENETKLEYISDMLDLQFERNGEKKSIKYFGKQYSANRNFLPFGTEILVTPDNKSIICAYTRKDAIHCEVTIFKGTGTEDYLRNAVHRIKHA